MKEPEGAPDAGELALAELLRRLHALAYRFVTVTPATHARVLERNWSGPATLRDVFGWSRRFGEGDLDPALLALLEAGDALERSAEGLRSRVRVAALGGDLFLHSAYPTDQSDAVFFGPDTYRFARFLRETMPLLPAPRWIVDMGAGSGAGGIAASRHAPRARLTLLDVNPAALHLARVNAAAAGVAAEFERGDRLPRGADLVIANPPYMVDAKARDYRHGGGLLGGAVALDWTRQALAALAPGGSLLLYTGAAVTDGRLPLVEALHESCADAGARLEIDEIDPDVFGEELDQPAYRDVERIAAIGVRVTVSG
jgi:methylase of polypeptide subunit release factors